MSDTPTAPSTLKALWSHGEAEVRTYLPIPPWIDQLLQAREVADILYGGCVSAPYTPARESYTARITMGRYGDQVLAYIAERTRVPEAASDTAVLREELAILVRDLDCPSWSALCVAILSWAVELWAAAIADDLVRAMG